MKEKTNKLIQSKQVQNALAFGRMVIDMVIIIGTASLAAYLYTSTTDKVVLVLSAAFGAISIVKLAQVAYAAELKGSKR